MGEGSRSFGRPALDAIPAGRPLATPASLAVELGVERVVNLSLNEGPFGPFPAALAAIAAVTPDLNRYPSRGAHDLTLALAQRLRVSPDEVIVTAGADAAIGYVCQAVIEPDEEAIVPWPSFPSFAWDVLKRGARPVTVPLVAARIDLDAVLAAVTPRTRLVFVATPNNPTGLAVPRGDLRAFVDALPDHVLPVVDEAYVEYLEPDAGDAVADLFLEGRRLLAIRTFSKMYGLAGLRVGYAVGPAAVIEPMRKVQRGFDVNAAGQAAALASLGHEAEVARRRAANREAVARLEASLVAHDLSPLEGSVANFVLAQVGDGAGALAAALRARGVIVQEGAPFGAPAALRITAGTAEETAALSAALTRAGRPHAG